MTPVEVLWAQFLALKSLCFLSRSKKADGWSGVGTGEVVVAQPSVGVLTFTETGLWQPDQGREVPFTNLFRWTILGPARVRLEHLRFGPDKPVLLFELEPTDEKEGESWTSTAPHLCRDDCYSAVLSFEESGVRLEWTVEGPRKSSRIVYIYASIGLTSSP